MLGFLVQRTSTTVHLCPWSSVMIREAIMLKNHTSNGSARKGSPLSGRAPVSHQKHGMPNRIPDFDTICLSNYVPMVLQMFRESDPDGGDRAAKVVH